MMNSSNKILLNISNTQIEETYRLRSQAIDYDNRSETFLFKRQLLFFYKIMMPVTRPIAVKQVTYHTYGKLIQSVP